ncbi:MAG TPA: Xaa-Pro peptidase family protein [Vicinamibacterales bacterium]|nr:Xaa-Pro peptidase family protein [Vicinamibacterales bacterium]
MTVDRIARLRADLQSLDLDTLVVTHPPNIRYLTGLSASAGAAVVSLGGCTLIVDSRYLDAARSVTRGRPDVSVRLASRGIDATVAEDVLASGATRVGVEGAHLPVARYNRLSAAIAAGARGTVAGALAPTERLVERRRAVKDAEELLTIREAGRRLSDVARRARQFLQPGRTEQAAAAMVDAALREGGFERPAFDTIVASGPNSARPHARPTSRVLGDGEGVVLDFGGVYDGYCVDLTRTLHMGVPSAEFRRVFDAVREAHSAAIAAVQPGALATDIDGAARRVLERHGLLEAFGHGTGHGLGLEVHEDPRISPLAPADERVTAGMVFTIEPGAYVPGIGGVRIEDDVLVVDGGCELLTNVPIDL